MSVMTTPFKGALKRQSTPNKLTCAQTSKRPRIEDSPSDYSCDGSELEQSSEFELESSENEVRLLFPLIIVRDVVGKQTLRLC